MALVWVAVTTKTARPLNAAPMTKAMNNSRLICPGVSLFQKAPKCRQAMRAAAMRLAISPEMPWPAGRQGPSILIPRSARPLSVALRRGSRVMPWPS
eukprot:2066824-Pyramimonas_sp.AAC.1